MKTLYLFSFIMLTTITGYCQSDSTAAAVERTTFTIGSQYANNSSYYGQQPVDATPYLALVGSLRFPSGIYFTGMAYRLMKEKSAVVNAGSVTAGIGIKLSERWTSDLSFSHALYEANSPFLQASLNNTASASLSYNWWMNTSLTADYSFGTDHDVFATFGTSKSILFGTLFSSKDGISLTPEFNATAGTRHYYTTYVSKQILMDSLAGLPIPIFGSESRSDTSSKRSTSFQLLAYSVRLPLAYYRAHYQVEAAAQFSMPAAAARLTSSNINTFYTLSFYYQF